MCSCVLLSISPSVYHVGGGGGAAPPSCRPTAACSLAYCPGALAGIALLHAYVTAQSPCCTLRVLRTRAFARSSAALRAATRIGDCKSANFRFLRYGAQSTGPLRPEQPSCSPGRCSDSRRRALCTGPLRLEQTSCSPGRCSASRRRALSTGPLRPERTSCSPGRCARREPKWMAPWLSSYRRRCFLMAPMVDGAWHCL